MHHNLKAGLKIVAPVFLLGIFIYLNSIIDPCESIMKVIREQECHGKLKGKFTGRKHMRYLIVEHDTVWVSHYFMLYTDARPGDEVIKRHGETILRVVRNSDTEAYYPECSGETFWK